mmetsp:Transcript_12522/g.10756  ORF Transcript_12522/g.10756 Transcript_12522/m.10756 type:complete len:337 (-) Transcript_12522:85-1095(-)
MYTKAIILTAFLALAAYNTYTGILSNHNQDVDEVRSLFHSWKSEHQKYYQSLEEETFRLAIFTENLAKINEMNSQPDSKATFGLTQFADLTEEEFGSIYTGYNPESKKYNPENVVILNDKDLPDSVNWTAQGAVTPVKNQGECGSCWSFSTTGSTEGLNFIKTNKLLSFSEQQLMDCSYKYGNKGCLGGLMDDAFKYIIDKGIETEEEYPYKMRFDIKCHYDASKVVFNISGYTDVASNSVSQLEAAAVQQPVSVAVQANQASWQFYTGGIITKDCGDKLDHGVLVVGYGTESSTDYWIVKNSWGEKWGEQGYLRIERSGQNLCGILDQPSYPVKN